MAGCSNGGRWSRDGGGMMECLASSMFQSNRASVGIVWYAVVAVDDTKYNRLCQDAAGIRTFPQEKVSVSKH